MRQGKVNRGKESIMRTGKEGKSRGGSVKWKLQGGKKRKK